ncbi:class I SAM-dependent methyltransferase [Tamilnaduibacter salinus]|nr:hypothetical protein [Tamilnaduibacter salinus]
MNNDEVKPSVMENDDSGSGRDVRAIDFFRGFLKEPKQVGSVIPSSRFLERRIVSAAGLEQAKLVVELGPGTGGTTRAFLERLGNNARLLTIEMSADFVSLLDRIGDDRLVNHNGSAEHLPAILAEHGLGAPDAVISGIPFSAIPESVGGRIAESIRDSLAPGGRFVAYQFRGDVADRTSPVMGSPHVSTEFLNIPPMRVYCWQKS